MLLSPLLRAAVRLRAVSPSGWEEHRGLPILCEHWEGFRAHASSPNPAPHLGDTALLCLGPSSADCTLEGASRQELALGAPLISAGSLMGPSPAPASKTSRLTHVVQFSFDQKRLLRPWIFL